MIQIKLYRYRSDLQGTPGLWVMPDQVYDSLELPWRDNQKNISCIPPGTYGLIYVKARRYIGGRRDLYLLQGVPGRSGILNHAGTFAGDRSLGYRANVLGCILTGKAIGTYKGQLAVFNTRTAVGEIIHKLGGKPAELTISEVF